MGRENVMERDTGFWVGLSPQGTWESIRSLLPMSVVPKLLQNDFIAMEVVMKNGKKHAVFRSLATLGNESNVNLDISISHLSPNSGTSNNSVVEEIFQNQRYQPSSGWGNNWSGFGSVVSGPWSTRDFSNSSKDFSEPPLPTGWRWSSTWTIDKSQSADKDGWACGPDFRSLRWPPTSS
ncbi:Vacuolar protein sorting-associated protein, partial [Trema orientale]